jgi:hypothetical protein
VGGFLFWVQVCAQTKNRLSKLGELAVWRWWADRHGCCMLTGTLALRHQRQRPPAQRRFTSCMQAFCRRKLRRKSREDTSCSRDG